MLRRRWLSVCLILVAVACLSNSASAATLTWSNSGTTWSAASNWGGTAPGSSDTALFNYGPTYTYQPTLSSGTAVGGLWDTGSGSLTIGGASTLTLNGVTINSNTGTGIEIDPGAGAMTISAPVTLGGAQQWLNNSGNLLTASGGVANGGFTLTYAGSGNAVVGGITNTTLGLSGAGGVTMNGTGLLLLAGTGINYTGNTTVSSGTLEVYNTRNFYNGTTAGTGPANSISIASGAMFQFYADNSSGNVGDNANQGFGTNQGTTITGAGVFQKQGNGILASGLNGANELLTFAMSPGGLIDIENGGLRNGGWSNTTWTNNNASMYIASSGTMDIWDGKEVFIDALNGSGYLNKNQSNGTDLICIGVANGSGTFSGIIENTNTTGVLSLMKSGSGIEIFSGNNTYGGTTTISGGTLQIGNGGNTGTLGTGAVSNSGVLAFNRNDTGQVVANAISGTGSVFQIGSGLTALTGANSYGATTISAGTLQIGSGGNTGTLGTAAVSNSGVLAFARSDTGLSVANAINGTGAVVQVGPGLTALTGTNTYSGGTFINGGVLQFANSSALPSYGSATNVTINYGGALAVSGATNTVTGWQGTGNIATSSAGALALTGNTSNEAISMANYPALSLGATGSTTYSGSLTPSASTYYLGGGGGALTMGTAFSFAGSNGAFISGPGSVVLPPGNATSYTGPTAIGSNGTLQIGNGGIAQGVLASQTVVDAGTLLFNHSDLATYSGSLSGTGGLAQAGGGVLTLAGSGINYTGATTVSGGTLQVVGTTVLNGGNYSGAITIGSGAMVLNTSANQTLGGAIAIASGGALVLNTSGNPTLSGVISGAGSLYQLGSGLTTLTGASTLTGTATVSAGTLSLGNGGTTGSITGTVLDNSTLLINRSSNPFGFSTLVAGSGNVVYNGGGYIYPSASNTYTGTTTILGNTELYGLAGLSGTDTLSLGPTPPSFVSNQLTVNNGVIASYNTTENGGTAVTIAANRGIYLAGGTLTLRNAYGVQITINSVISGSGGIGKTDTNGSIALLNAANTFTGPTQWNTVGGQGAVGLIQLGNSLALQNSTVIENSTGGSLTFTGGIGTFTLGGLSGSTNQGLLDLSGSGITLSVGNNGSSNTYSGVLSGSAR